MPGAHARHTQLAWLDITIRVADLSNYKRK